MRVKLENRIHLCKAAEYIPPSSILLITAEYGAYSIDFSLAEEAKWYLDILFERGYLDLSGMKYRK